jgi:hypothetical protein
MLLRDNLQVGFVIISTVSHIYIYIMQTSDYGLVYGTGRLKKTMRNLSKDWVFGLRTAPSTCRIRYRISIMPITVAARPKARSTFALSNAWTIGSNLTRGKNVCFCFLSVCVVLWRYATGLIALEGVLLTLCKVHISRLILKGRGQR